MTGLLTLDTLTGSHGGHDQYVDTTGTAWLITEVEGWRGAPSRRTKHTQRATADGAIRGAAYRDTRNLVVKGRFFPPSLAVGLRHSRRVAALCPDPGERYRLTVADEDLVLCSYVEQAGEILCDAVRRDALWDFQVPLVAADPYLYEQVWVSASAAGGGEGSGGINFGGSGASFAAPGLAMGTAPEPIEVTARATGLMPSQVVYQVGGATSGVQIGDQAGPSIVGVRGEVAAGESLFVNCSGAVAFDVPDCPIPIPAYGAVLGGQSARSAVWVAGGWPVLTVGKSMKVRMTGALGTGASLTVHTRGAWV